VIGCSRSIVARRVGAGMERAEPLDFDGVEGMRKPLTFLLEKPRSRGSHASFLNEYEHSSSSNSPPSNPQSATNVDKDLNDEH
jgi:hypothetical protein